MTAIWVWLDDDDGRIPGLPARMAGEAARLAEAAGVRARGVAPNHAAAAAASAGGAANGLDVVYALTSGTASSAGVDLAADLADAVRREQPSCILFPASATGADLAGRVAALLARPLLAGCVDVEWRDGGLQLRREVHDRRAHLALSPSTPPPWILTLDPAVAHANDFPAATPPVEMLQAGEAGSSAIPIERWRLAASELDVMDADVVLAVGKGVDAESTLGQVFELAERLDAAVGGSREAVFAGMLPRERQIGASGKWIAPRVYVALGISGSSYHLMGIRDAQHVAAVNLDAGAPMLERAEWRAVADVGELVPALLRALAPRDT